MTASVLELRNITKSCPSCHARRLAEWSLWLAEHLLAPVVHRQVVLTVPKRLRAYFPYDRRRLGRLSQVAYGGCWTTCVPCSGSATRPPERANDARGGDQLRSFASRRVLTAATPG